MRRAIRLLTASALVLAAGCGSDGGTGPGNTNIGGDGGVTMSINGKAWRSALASDRATKTNQFLSISTVGTAGGIHALVITVGAANGPGTFSLNAGQTSNAIISDQTGGWGTAFTGGTGTLTITALNATHVAGTFSFDAT